MSNSGSQGHPMDTWEKLLQTLKNDKGALEKVQYETTDGIKTAIDPKFKTPIKTCGEDKLSFDKTVVDKPTTDSGKATPPYSDPQQVLECRSSQFNVPGLHQEQKDRVRIASFEQQAKYGAWRRTKRSIKALKDGKGRNVQSYLANEGTMQMMEEYKAGGSMEKFKESKMRKLALSLDAARVVSMHKAHTLGHNPGVMVGNRLGSETVVHDGDENGNGPRMATMRRPPGAALISATAITATSPASTTGATALALTCRTRCAAARHICWTTSRCMRHPHRATSASTT